MTLLKKRPWPSRLKPSRINIRKTSSIPAGWDLVTNTSENGKCAAKEKLWLRSSRTGLVPESNADLSQGADEPWRIISCFPETVRKAPRWVGLLQCWICSSQTLKKAISIACWGIRKSGVLLVLFFFFLRFIYLIKFFVALGLHRCVWAFSSSLRFTGFSLQWLFLLRSMSYRVQAQ